LRCPASPGSRLLSQRRVDQAVNVAPERIWVHPWEVLAATNEFGRASTGSGQRAKLSHWRAVARNDDAFAVLDAAQDFSPIVSEVAYCHRVHIASVSPVRRRREGPRLYWLTRICVERRGRRG
jgi:hypothetical protein